MACAALRAALPPGRVACHGEPRFAAEAVIFNRNLQAERAPLIVATPETLAHVATVMRAARDFKLRLAVRNGGHNPAGWALSPGGITLDMSLQRSVRLVRGVLPSGEAAAPHVEVGGGALWRHVNRELDGTGLYAVGGGCAGVGVAGLALNGGIAFTSRHRGLIGDGVLSYTLVLPNGSVIDTASASGSLHSALQAAGGSTIGVVWAMRIRLWPVPAGGHGLGLLNIEFKAPHSPRRMIEMAAAAHMANLHATADEGAWALTLIVGARNFLFHTFYDGPAPDWRASGDARGVFERLANVSSSAKRDEPGGLSPTLPFLT